MTGEFQAYFVGLLVEVCVKYLDIFRETLRVQITKNLLEEFGSESLELLSLFVGVGVSHRHGQRKTLTCEK